MDFFVFVALSPYSMESIPFEYISLAVLDELEVLSFFVSIFECELSTANQTQNNKNQSVIYRVPIGAQKKRRKKKCHLLRLVFSMSFRTFFFFSTLLPVLQIDVFVQI